MCLYSETKECRVAEEPITVYKYVAKKYKILDGAHKGERVNINALRDMRDKSAKTKPVFVGPYYPSASVAYLVGETVKDDNFQAVAREKYCNVLGPEFTVDYGLHTFKYQKDADMRAKGFVSIDYETAVLRCTIPAGARYYEGDVEYCSDTLVVKEVLTEYVSPDI